MTATRLAFVFACLLGARALAGEAREGAPVPMPGGGAGIGFDDLGYAPGLKKVLVPGGRTGKLFLVDPLTRRVASLDGFTAASGYRGGHGVSVTSADEGRGLLFGSDRSRGALLAVDPLARKVVAAARLTGGPDYVRYVAPTGEVWVSEPDARKIEVFALSSAGGAWSLAKTAEIAVPGGPESLIVDAARGRAYAHTWKDESLAIGLKSRTIEARWKNGCRSSRGIALDAERGLLFVGCDEGKAVVLDAARDGRILSSLDAGSGVDVIAYSAKTRRLFVPGARSATLAVMSVSAAGTLGLVRTLTTAAGAHCAAADADGGAWVCDPDHGRLLYFGRAAFKPE